MLAGFYTGGVTELRYLLVSNPRRPTDEIDFEYRGTSLKRNSPPPRAAKGSRHIATVGSQEGAISYDRGAPVLRAGGSWQQLLLALHQFG